MTPQLLLLALELLGDAAASVGAPGLKPLVRILKFFVERNLGILNTSDESIGLKDVIHKLDDLADQVAKLTPKAEMNTAVSPILRETVLLLADLSEMFQKLEINTEKLMERMHKGRIRLGRLTMVDASQGVDLKLNDLFPQWSWSTQFEGASVTSQQDTLSFIFPKMTAKFGRKPFSFGEQIPIPFGTRNMLTVYRSAESFSIRVQSAHNTLKSGPMKLRIPGGHFSVLTVTPTKKRRGLAPIWIAALSSHPNRSRKKRRELAPI